MRAGLLVWVFLLAASTVLPGCPRCLEQGRNGVPDPEAGEFQLVFNNIVSRETDIYVDGDKVGTVCQETEYATVGNFPVGTHTELMAHSKISSSDCYLSPCCTPDCAAQVCNGARVVDTTPFDGSVFNTGLIWAD